MIALPRGEKRNQRLRPARACLAVLLTLVIAVASNLVVVSTARAEADPADKIEAKVLSQIASEGETTFWAILGEKRLRAILPAGSGKPANSGERTA